MLDAMAAPSAPRAGNPPCPKIRSQFQDHVQHVRPDDDHHARNRAADALEKEARGHVQQNRRHSEPERRQHSAAAGRDVRRLAGRKQERLPERACDRHHRAGHGCVHEGGAPDRSASLRSAGTDGLRGEHDGAHQQPDTHQQQRDLRRDGDRVPGEIVPDAWPLIAVSMVTMVSTPSLASMTGNARRMVSRRCTRRVCGRSAAWWRIARTARCSDRDDASITDEHWTKPRDLSVSARRMCRGSVPRWRRPASLDRSGIRVHRSPRLSAVRLG